VRNTVRESATNRHDAAPSKVRAVTSGGSLVKLKTIYGVIVIVILVATAGLWWMLLQGIWDHPVGDGAKPCDSSTGLFFMAGALLAALGTSTAAALGFSIAELKRGGGSLTFSNTVETVGLPVILSTFVYILIGAAVAYTTWKPVGAGSFEALEAYAVSFVGWLVGALPVALKPTD
jgi:hypothetical protein